MTMRNLGLKRLSIVAVHIPRSLPTDGILWKLRSGILKSGEIESGRKEDFGVLTFEPFFNFVCASLGYIYLG